MLDIERIKEVIPHRNPFLLVDKILEINEGKRAVGIKCDKKGVAKVNNELVCEAEIMFAFSSI